MRVVSRATCTSGEPVSLGCLRYSATIASFSSFKRGTFALLLSYRVVSSSTLATGDGQPCISTDAQAGKL